MENKYDGLEAFAQAKIKTVESEPEKVAKEVQSSSQQHVSTQKEEYNKEEYNQELLSFIFEKSFDCPVCDKPFKANTTKAKVKLEGVDEDLMPTYAPVDPLLYDALLCPNCGYCALRSVFLSINERQGEYILAEITPKYKHRPRPPIMNIDEAIADYKLALLNCMVKKGKLNEKGYICMKISWLYKRKEDTKNELAYIKQAYENFTEALSKEQLPFCGLDENTVNYILARFSMKLGLLDDSMRFISRIIVSSTISSRLKERAIDMKEVLRTMMKKAEK